ncbi:oxidoreductase [Chlorobiota bacterium]|nr:oxidoreductase [Chlorobiota bacterium]
MLQVVQYQKNGEMSIADVPAPTCKPGGILVKTFASLISAGTEKTSVIGGQSSLLERARKQPDQVKQVLDTVKKEGLISTLGRIQSKLESYKTLGYSAAGIVIESRCEEFSPGDRVACAGAQYAHHAEFISVPKNLAVHIPDNVSFDEAAYTTLGAIALQGVRQAHCNLGETVAVIGLGLLGQLTIQLLKASGCKVIGMDINPTMLHIASELGCDLVLPSSKEHISSIMSFTRNIGTDAVIITASTQSEEPIQLALEISRKKSPIVIVGAVPMNIPRSPFYEKELELRISCSYGPGRYDPLYEEHGIDYPVGYVRWTENRNMSSFIDLISSGQVTIKPLTTHHFVINKALDAYALITGEKKEPYLGIILHYLESETTPIHSISTKHYKPSSKQHIGIGFIGAGSFAQAQLLPPLASLKVHFAGVSTSSPANALSVANQYGFGISSTSSKDIIELPDTDIVFCATRHDSHAHYVLSSLKQGKPVFVEKPLCVHPDELAEISSVMAETHGRVMVGYNRRFSAPFVDIQKFFEKRSAPMSIMYRVNAGSIPLSSWIQDPLQGGRIIGEGCHFIDCMVFLTGSLPISVHAVQLPGANRAIGHHDCSHIIITFADGSIGTLLYLANGDSSIDKEYCEVFCEGKTAIMNNFTSVVFGSGKKSKTQSYNGKKGHKQEVDATILAVKNGTSMPISFQEIYAITQATFAAEESMNTGLTIQLHNHI